MPGSEGEGGASEGAEIRREGEHDRSDDDCGRSRKTAVFLRTPPAPVSPSGSPRGSGLRSGSVAGPGGARRPSGANAREQEFTGCRGGPSRRPRIGDQRDRGAGVRDARFANGARNGRRVRTRSIPPREAFDPSARCGDRRRDGVERAGHASQGCSEVPGGGPPTEMSAPSRPPRPTHTGLHDASRRTGLLAARPHRGVCRAPSGRCRRSTGSGGDHDMRPWFPGARGRERGQRTPVRRRPACRVDT